MNKRWTWVLLVGLLYCGSTAAQDGPNNIVAALIGPAGPLQGLVKSAQAGDLQPLVDGLVSNNGLIEGGIVTQLNTTLSGVVHADPTKIANGVPGTVFVTLQAVGTALNGGKGLNAVIGAGGLVDLTYGTGQLLGLPQGGDLALPGLPGGSPLSASQLQQFNALK